MTTADEEFDDEYGSIAGSTGGDISSVVAWIAFAIFIFQLLSIFSGPIGSGHWIEVWMAVLGLGACGAVSFIAALISYSRKPRALLFIIIIPTSIAAALFAILLLIGILT